jgi:hypothetical protein
VFSGKTWRLKDGFDGGRRSDRVIHSNT